MHADGIKLLNLMFRSGETICPHHTKYAYHSLPLENAFLEKVTLVPKDSTRKYEYVDSNKLALVALNPINGFRADVNCTAYRNFLIEIDTGTTDKQLEYIKDYKIPYSAAIFSGNKSVHFLISLSEDLPSEKIYRFFAQWILNVLTMADQNTKNPSRSIRIPGAERDPGKFQKLLEFNGSVNLKDLIEWLKGYPQSRPKERVKIERVPGDQQPDFDNLKPWVKKWLFGGLKTDKGRNAAWFSVSCEMALTGFDESDTIEILEKFFEPERDFKRKEFEAAIKSAFKYIKDRK